MHGFGVQKGDSGKDCEGNLVRYRFFCNKKGLRERKHYDRVDRRREHKPKTRTNCKAMLLVRKLVTEHNHELTPTGMVHLIANHRGLTEIVMSQIDGMQVHGIATAKIVGYMASMAGGYSLLGFLKKDDAELCGLFRRWLYAEMATEDFESEWEQATDMYGLREKKWSCQMYDKKEMWASAYLRDKFCAGYRTTSRCEGINAHVNKFLKSTHTIYELVQSLEMVAREYQNRELLL
ncbi:hypothetical protein Ahy_B02g059984 [Arachis hypogaea]|uniref:FAR1 domain-containing protein n=1 Tax=Arachis hypogaea TaxID=3818 RepID=A0A445AHM8_ARAHY|nr:hypothetical protein Ahy_B02g059984 [Arachis hypogaea]